MFIYLYTGTFMGRCCLLCLLWVGTNWMYMYALSVLDATDVMALFATNLSFVYLLSWVVLHIQFVGLRVSFYKIKSNLKCHFNHLISFVIQRLWPSYFATRVSLYWLTWTALLVDHPPWAVSFWLQLLLQDQPFTKSFI